MPSHSGGAWGSASPAASVVVDVLVLGVDGSGADSGTVEPVSTATVTSPTGDSFPHPASMMIAASHGSTLGASRSVRSPDMKPKPPLPGDLSLGSLAKAYLARGLVAGTVVGFMLGLLNALSAGFTTDASIGSLIGRFAWTMLWSVIGGGLGGITLTAVLNGFRRAMSSGRWHSPMVRALGAVSGVLMGLMFARSLFLAAVGGLAGYLWSWPVPGSPEALEAGI